MGDVKEGVKADELRAATEAEDRPGWRGWCAYLSWILPVIYAIGVAVAFAIPGMDRLGVVIIGAFGGLGLAVLTLILAIIGLFSPRRGSAFFGLFISLGGPALLWMFLTALGSAMGSGFAPR